MNLSNEDIKKEIKKGNIKIEPKISEDQIGPGSIDLTLSNEFWVIKNKYKNSLVDLKLLHPDQIFEKKISNFIILKSKELCLGITKEKLTLSSNIMGRLEGRSKYARMGLAVHITSSLVQPGSSNRQVLEIVNLAPYSIKLYAGMRISQICLSYTKTKTSKPYFKFGQIAVKQ